MKAHFKEVDPHKIQLYKKKVKSNKKKIKIHQVLKIMAITSKSLIFSTKIVSRISLKI